MAKKKEAVENTNAEAQQAPVQEAPKPVKDERNGVTRPATGSTRRVWEIADALSQEKGAPASRKEVTEAAEKEGLVIGTIHTQYGRWCKYYGLVKPAEERARIRAEAKAAKEAEKEAKKAEKAQAAEEKAKAKAAKDAEKAAKAAEKAQAANEPADE